MNAVEKFTALMPADAVRRLATVRVLRFDVEAPRPPPRRDLDIEAARAAVAQRWAADLCGLLNAMTRGELARLASTAGIAATGRSFELRTALWHHGAALERGGLELPPAVQPRPVVLGGHLVIQAAPRGLYPSSAAWPRPTPQPALSAPPGEEPETIDDLLAAADRAIGVRLGRRGRDKGAWGIRAAELLGVIERGEREPDWRGDVEIKTMPIARDPSGLWRIVEDPAIAMIAEPRALAKLQRTLWLARADVDPERGPRYGGDSDATIVSWYLLDWDPDIARLARRYLHARPKGPAGTDQRGLYLHKRFFADAGLLATLNGP